MQDYVIIQEMDLALTVTDGTLEAKNTKIATKVNK